MTGTCPVDVIGSGSSGLDVARRDLRGEVAKRMDAHAREESHRRELNRQGAEVEGATR
jgi:hypothetical protein